jgi:hypothetical protein
MSTTPRKLDLQHTPRAGDVEDAGNAVKVHFEVKGGEAFDSTAAVGWTCMMLKARCADKLGVPVAALMLMYKGKPLIDPLSLVDVDPHVAETGMTILVEKNK